tara:strand:- start:3241 stop:4089 length:849 start_codon:yes stop_codon:yes gene_type:complete
MDRINSELKAIPEEKLKELLKVAKESALIGSKVLKKYFNKLRNIESKGRKGDLVTNADIESEEKIKEYLTRETSYISILAEEAGQDEKVSDLQWCIDPLDGTTNFVHGYPFYATSIGLLFKNIPIIGAISIPSMEEIYWGCIGNGAFCNGEKIKVSQAKSLEDSLLVTGFAYDRFQVLDNNYAEFCKLTHKTRGVRRGGAAAVDLAYVASGKIDGYWERGLEKWDLAAGSIIVKEAGGYLSNYPSGDFDISTGRILACTPSIERELKYELSDVKPLEKKYYD